MHLRVSFLLSVFLFIVVLTIPAAVAGDLLLPPGSLRYSSKQLVEGHSMRLYAYAGSADSEDQTGMIQFFFEGKPVGAPQPVSVVDGRSDDVFVDIILPFGGYVDLSARLDQSTIKLPDVFVDYDPDGDGVGNLKDPDDDNDGIPDQEEGKTTPQQQEGSIGKSPESTPSGGVSPVSPSVPASSSPPAPSSPSVLSSPPSAPTGSTVPPVSQTPETPFLLAPPVAQVPSSNAPLLKAPQDSDSDGLSDVLERRLTFNPLVPASRESIHSFFAALPPLVLGEKISREGQEDLFPQDPSPSVVLKYTHQGLLRYTLDASSSVDNGKIVKYLLFKDNTLVRQQSDGRFPLQFFWPRNISLFLVAEDNLGQQSVMMGTLSASLLPVRIFSLFLLVTSVFLLSFFRLWTLKKS